MAMMMHGYIVNTILETASTPVDNNNPENTKANPIKV